MGLSTVKEDTDVGLAMIRLGYDGEHNNFETRHLDFVVGFSNIEVACEAVDIIDSYNNFDASSVKRSLELAWSKLSFGTIYIGREASPVIYIRDYGMKEQTISEIMAFMLAASADEVDYDKHNSRVRAWWD